MEEEFPWEGMPSVWDADNQVALSLQRQLQEQPVALMEYRTSLAGKEPFYPYVRLLGMPDYGLCYFIPS